MSEMDIEVTNAVGTGFLGVFLGGITLLIVSQFEPNIWIIGEVFLIIGAVGWISSCVCWLYIEIRDLVRKRSDEDE
jgi:hypothetical protein